MKPQRVKKAKYKFTAQVDRELFLEANQARIKIGETWVNALEREFRQLIQQARDKK